MRFRSLALALLAAATAFVLFRRRRPREFVDVFFEDGSMLRLSAGREARDLLDDADAILELAS